MTNSKGWDVRVAQARLQVIYEQKFLGLVSALADLENETLSYPQLLDISAQNYGKAQTKLMVVGQQTQTWYGEWNDLKTYAPEDGVRKLMNHYREFNLGDGKRQTPFWQYAHKLYTLLNPTGPENGCIWSNLIKMDGLDKKGKWGYPGWPIEERINKSFNIIISEADMAEPDVVVFFTGRSYDECLGRSFPGAKLCAVPQSGLDFKWLSVVKHDRLPEHSYRTYHPGYLNRQPNRHSVLDEIRDLVLGKRG